MIKIYGADAVRWFILSDSPPDKDIQWSNQGVNASYKFLQKIWNLSIKVTDREDQIPLKELEHNFRKEFNGYLNKITKLIENFQLNVVVANSYEIYRLINENFDKKISNACIKEIIIDFMKILIPFIPHIASECLDKLMAKNTDLWPEINKQLLEKQTVKIAIQINGKTKEVIEVTKDLIENDAVNESKKNLKIIKNLENKKIKKIIYVKNKIINYLVE